MRKIPSLFFVAKKVLLTLPSLVIILFISMLYILFSLFVLNNQLVIQTIASSAPLGYKVLLFGTLLQGLFTAFTPSDTAMMLASSILVGINLLLVSKSLQLLKNQGKVRLSVGGATLISLITTGCSSCGFSLLSILGLGTSLSFLPFHGMELHIASVLLLIFSAWYMIKKLRDGVYCKIR